MLHGGYLTRSKQLLRQSGRRADLESCRGRQRQRAVVRQMLRLRVRESRAGRPVPGFIVIAQRVIISHQDHDSFFQRRLSRQAAGWAPIRYP